MDATQYGGAYLKAKDADQVSNFRILSVSEGTDYDNNPCLELGLSGDKKWQLKVRDVNALVGLFGKDTDGWIDKAITLTKTQGDYNGTPYDYFTIKEYVGKAKSSAPPVPMIDEIDDELGF